MSLPSFSVDGKVTVVTGASGDIGRALALGFAAAGSPVVLVSRRPGPLQTLANQIKTAGGRALAVSADVTRKEQVVRMVESAASGFGRVDVLINCAGGGSYESTLEMAEESWDSMVDLNLKSVFLCSQAAGKVMVRQRSGVIINFATGAAHSPVPGEIHYSSAKAGVVHFTRVLAAEWGRFGIRVNCISPGVVDGGLARRVMGSDFEKYAKRTALGRAAVPEDFVGVCLFLASDAASYISGVVINVSGGPI